MAFALLGLLVLSSLLVGLALTSLDAHTLECKTPADSSAE
ncbi:hypothetical protein LSI01_19220 [Furfurilactobacillus siliginis]|uniref:Uncharacterized protein n=1 Tax=Furfurilactobacillus siliginis TaxID=348151 RepID=A0A510VU70_9LACO|nr:hypothetical protein LSI01_19220 [Furfurilactobacillus siliginis]